MAYSIVQYTGNGSVQLFGVTFPFISRDHVSVKVNGVAVPFGWLNDSLVQTTAAPANGTIVTISRDSNRSAPIVDFQDAAILTEADLDLANKQAVYVAQEAFDATNVVQVSADVASNAAAAATSASNAAVAAAAASVSQGAALTSAINAAASAAAAATFTPPIAIAYGGTGATTYQGAINALTNVSAAAAGKVLTKVGTDATWADPVLPGTVLAVLGGDGKFFRGDGVVTDTLNVGTNGMRLSTAAGGDMQQFFAPSNALDEKLWAWRLSAPQTLSLYAYNDAVSVLNYALQIQRSGATISRVAIGGKLLQGDFNNATVANRLMHQTVNANANSYVGAIPNGTGTEAAWQLYSKSDLTLAQAAGGMRMVQGDSVQFRTENINTGTTLPFKWMVDAAEKMRLDTAGKLGIGCTPAATLDVNGQARIVGGSVPASGAGLELSYGSNTGTLIAYDRTGAAYKNMSYDGAQHLFRVSGVQRMFIDSTGAPLITANASTCLTLQNGSASDNIQIRFHGNASAVDQWAIGNMISTGGTGRLFQVYDLVAGAARLSIDSGGITTLHSAGTAGYENQLTLNNPHNTNSDFTTLFFACGGTTQVGLEALRVDANNGLLLFKSRIAGSYAERMRLTENSNLLLGTTTDTGAQDKMHIFGSAGSGGRVNALTLGNAVTDATGNCVRLRLCPSGGFTASPTVAPYIEVVDENAATNAAYMRFGVYTGAAQIEAFRLKSGGGLLLAQYGAGTLVTDASGNVTASSDERLKDIEGSFSLGLDAIKALAPISYKWKESTGYDRVNSYVGFSAQNVASVIPQAVSTDPAGNLSLQDRPIIAALVNAVQELAAKVAFLESKVA